MPTIRQLTRKGDPMLRIHLPEQLLLTLQSESRSNKRRIQDELIKRLTLSLQHENSSNQAIQKLLPELKEIYSTQTI